ncbi:CheR family methyltransferase [Roseococcus thiosulfatophilus]|uniref:CheR family methyltransferase n=1 Tax=Roseococcus thiosulfatophilus TaxID=35813 RepID=UPI001A90AF66|nr:CheR family methyltransferase [Roseococcus thiosulfatophilus]
MSAPARLADGDLAEGVMAAVGRIAGLAPSPVLAGRLAAAAALLPACAAAPEHHDHPAWAALLDAVTVQETRLFRIPAQCAALGALLPGIAARARAEGRALRLLSAGCASGEEAFTLAALARAAAPDWPVEVLGLDLCRPALARAQSGRLEPGLGDPLALVPPALLPDFANGQPAPALRARARFRRANLHLDLGAAGEFDVVFCRNVLIYLTEPAREALLARLRAALAPGGVLGLGPTDRHPPGMAHLGENLLDG